MKKKLIIAAVIAVALIAGYFGLQQYMKARYEREIADLKALVQQGPQVVYQETVVEKDAVVSGETIEAGLNDIGKLCTAEYYFTHVTDYESSKQFHGFNIPLTKARFIFSYDGSILAGVDFEQVEVTKDDETKTIEVKLPEVETISTSIDPDSFRLYDESNNIFNPISVTDVTDSYAALIEDEEQKAIGNGLYERAEKNAAMLIESFLKGTYGMADYTVQITVQ